MLTSSSSDVNTDVTFCSLLELIHYLSTPPLNMKGLSYKTLFQRSWHPAILPVRVSLSHVHHKVPPEDFGHDHAWLQAVQCLFLSSAASNISACSFFHFPHLTESTILSTNQGSIISSSDFLSDWLLIFPIFCSYFLEAWQHGGRGIWHSLLLPSCWQHTQGSGLN